MTMTDIHRNDFIKVLFLFFKYETLNKIPENNNKKSYYDLINSLNFTVQPKRDIEPENFVYNSQEP